MKKRGKKVGSKYDEKFILKDSFIGVLTTLLTSSDKKLPATKAQEQKQ